MTIEEMINNQVAELDMKHLTPAQSDWLHFIRGLANWVSINRQRRDLAMIKKRVAKMLLLVMCSVGLSGCGKDFYAFYGRKDFWDFIKNQGCIQESGVDCETQELYREVDARNRAALRRAIKESK